MVEQEGREASRQLGQKERIAHDFRFEKTTTPAVRAALQVIRDSEGIWDKVAPMRAEQQKLEERTASNVESHRIGAALFSKIYRNPEAAALYDTALYDATQGESEFFRRKIEEGVNYSPLTVVGIGGVYGTIFSAASLKENPQSPPFGFDAGKRSGGIWGVSGDVTLDKASWRMNSRNRPSDKDELSLPGTKGNLNSLGDDVQNLQVPDISSAQYPTNNELGRVLSHDNFLSNNTVVNAELVKVRANNNEGQKGQFEQEYQDKSSGRRFFVYTDRIVQATGLGKERLGFDPNPSSTKEVLEEVQEDLDKGVKTPRLLTFLQLVEATTSNRQNVALDFKNFGIVGIGDTQKVIIENVTGIGGIERELPAQRGFVEKIKVFGLEKKTLEELRRTERGRYALQLLEFARERGGYFRVEAISGRVVGVGIPKDGKGIAVYYLRTDETPEGKVTTLSKIPEIVPRLVTAAGFVDMSNSIYSGLNAQAIDEKEAIKENLDVVLKKPGATIFYDQDNAFVKMNNIVRMDIDEVFLDGRFVNVTIIDREGNTTKKRIDRQDFKGDSIIIDPNAIQRLELPGDSPKFEPFFDSEYDPEIPVAEKASGFEIYKIGACTSYLVTEKEKRQTSAYENVPQNTKSIFRYSGPIVAFARKIASTTPRVEGALNLQKYSEKRAKLSYEDDSPKRDVIEVLIDPRNLSQKLSPNLKTDTLLKYLALSRLNCVFPQNISSVSFGIKRVQNEDGQSSFVIQSDPLIPEGDEWKVIDSFFADSLVQRALLQLTRKTSNVAELKIGIKRQMVDIREIVTRSVKGYEENDFFERYPLLKKKDAESSSA